jgi:hypothetical protein
MDEALAAALRRIAGAGHTVTVLSLAPSGLDTSDLGNLRVFELTESMRSLEARPLAAPEASS